MGNCCFKGKDNNDDNHELEEDSSNLRSQDHNNRSSFNNNNNNTLFYSNDKAYTSPALVTLSKLQQQQQQQLQPHDKIELQVKSLNLFLENFQFQLNSYVDLDQNSFQDKWQSFYFSQNFEYPMLKNNKSEVLEQIDFEDFLSKHYIFTLASGKSNGTLKLYLYAQEKVEDDSQIPSDYLMELIFNFYTYKLNVKLKSNLQQRIEIFLQYLEYILQEILAIE